MGSIEIQDAAKSTTEHDPANSNLASVRAETFGPPSIATNPFGRVLVQRSASDQNKGLKATPGEVVEEQLQNHPWFAAAFSAIDGLAVMGLADSIAGRGGGKLSTLGRAAFFGLGAAIGFESCDQFKHFPGRSWLTGSSDKDVSPPKLGGARSERQF
jgi:hypothetical protein